MVEAEKEEWQALEAEKEENCSSRQLYKFFSSFLRPNELLRYLKILPKNSAVDISFALAPLIVWSHVLIHFPLSALPQDPACHIPLSGSP